MSENQPSAGVDAILGGGGDAVSAALATPSAPTGGVQVYDFGRPARISKDRKRSLLAIYDILAKSLEGWLMGRMRAPVEIDVESVEAMSFAEFTMALRPPCVSFVLDIDGPGGQQGVLDFGPEFAFLVVDRFLGGCGAPHVPDRTLTHMERLVVRIVADRATTQLADAWKEYVALDLSIEGFESIPEMLQAANREDPMLVATLRVRVDDLDSALLVSLPFQVLEKFFNGDGARRQARPSGTPEERQKERRHLEESLMASRVNVAARLPAFDVPLGELAALAAGSTLLTGLAPESHLEVFVDGQRRFLGTAGLSNRQVAVRVTGEVPSEARARTP